MFPWRLWYLDTMKRAATWIIALLTATTAVAHDHVEARIFVIRVQPAQAAPKPIVFIGDRIVEAHAGIGGTTSYTYAHFARRDQKFGAGKFLFWRPTQSSFGGPNRHPGARPAVSRRRADRTAKLQGRRRVLESR